MRRALIPRLTLLAAGLIGIGATAGPAAAADSSAPAGPPMAATAATAAPSSTSGQITFGLQPASAVAGTVQGDDRPYFEYGLTPGSVIHDNVAVTNFSAKPVVLQLYSTDSVNTADGGFALLAGDQSPTDAGAWSSLAARTTITVPARGQDAAGNQQPGLRIVAFTVSVPDSATPGDHVGGLVASLSSASASTNGPSVRLDQRVATRMFLRVSGPLHPALTVSALAVKYHDPGNPVAGGRATVSFTVHNGGNVALTGHESVVLHGLFGTTTGQRVEAPLPMLLPGNDSSVTVDVPGVRPQGSLTASVAISQISSPGRGAAALADILRERKLLVIPWYELGALAGLLVVLLLWRLRRARSAARAGRHNQASARSRRHAPTAGRRRAGQARKVRRVGKARKAGPSLAPATGKRALRRT